MYSTSSFILFMYLCQNNQIKIEMKGDQEDSEFQEGLDVIETLPVPPAPPTFDNPTGHFEGLASQKSCTLFCET